MSGPYTCVSVLPVASVGRCLCTTLPDPWGLTRPSSVVVRSPDRCLPRRGSPRENPRYEGNCGCYRREDLLSCTLVSTCHPERLGVQGGDFTPTTSTDMIVPETTLRVTYSLCGFFDIVHPCPSTGRTSTGTGQRDQ